MVILWEYNLTTYDVWCDVLWCDMMWCDMMWYDVIWCDVLWCDMIWYDVYDVMWYDVYDVMCWYVMWLLFILLSKSSIAVSVVQRRYCCLRIMRCCRSSHIQFNKCDCNLRRIIFAAMWYGMLSLSTVSSNITCNIFFVCSPHPPNVSITNGTNSLFSLRHCDMWCDCIKQDISDCVLRIDVVDHITWHTYNVLYNTNTNTNTIHHK